MFRVIIASVCIVPYFNIWAIASLTPFTLFIDILGDKYSVLQSFSFANFNLFLKYLLIFYPLIHHILFKINSPVELEVSEIS